MDILSVSEIKSIDQEQSSEIIKKTENKEDIILIYFDPNNETEEVRKRLNQINDCIIFQVIV